MRKKYDERLNEILDAAGRLFSEKGFEKTTVNDILHEVDIGKGTFYHYFTSKDEVMDTVIMRVVEQYTDAAESIAADTRLSPHQKFAAIVLGQATEIDGKEDMIPELHEVENARMHQKSIVETIKALVPILTGVINEGISQGVFSTPYPQESIEILLVANQFLFDTGVFTWEPTEMIKKAEAFVYSMETLLGAEKGSFGYILEHYKKEAEGIAHE